MGAPNAGQYQSSDNPPVHDPESVVSLPPDLPATDQTVPKVKVTQEQVDYMVGLAGHVWPTLYKYKSTIAAVLIAVGAACGMLGNSIAKWPAVPTQPVVEQPAPKAVQLPTNGKLPDAKSVDVKGSVDGLRSDINTLIDVLKEYAKKN